MKINNLKQMMGGLLAIAMLLALASCGQQGQQSTQMPEQSQEVQVPEPEPETPAPGNSGDTQPEETEPATDSQNGKTLVAYYSATGSTQAVAGYIADTLGADLFEIIPTEPYTSDDLDWTDENSRVSREHDDPSMRVVELASATVDDWDAYDTVFIGYPIWWGIAAWPVNGFVNANDFTGKTVIPFCTSSSSGLGESGELLSELAGTGDWQEGQRFAGRSSQADVQSWIESLDI